MAFVRFLLQPYAYGPLLLIGGFVAYGVVVQPEWLVDPAQKTATSVLEAIGAGAQLVLWVVVFAFLFLNRITSLIRRWRLVLAFGMLAMAVQGTLAYFEAELPVIGVASLGGTLGDQIQGGEGFVGVLRVSGLWLVGLIVLAPRLARKGAAGTARGYRQAPAHRGVAWLARGAAVGAGAAVGGAVSVVRKGAERSRARQSEGLARDLGSFLSGSTPHAADSGGFAPIDAGGFNPLDTGAPPPFLARRLEAPPAAPEESHALQGPVQESEPVEGNPEPQVYDEPHGMGDEDGPAAASATGPRPRKFAAGAMMLPSESLLAAATAASAVTDEHNQTASLIEEALGQHGVEVRVAEIRPGPSVTMFGLVPGWNRRPRSSRSVRVGESEVLIPPDLSGPPDDARNRVKVDSILAREKDLALALAAPSLRIEAPVPGESVVGVEVPNKSSTMVSIRSVMDSEEYRTLASGDRLPVALGLATAGEPVAIDLLKMPHLLIAGATGSGKSVCINTIISSLIMHQQPSNLRLMLVDPKRVELTPYNGIPHLVTPVVVDPDRVVRLLRGAIQEMLRRYRLLEEARVRNLQSYNRSSRATERLPYFVICIDELADLMMTASFEVEQAICRLAQLGRATGIHMVVATQRPSVDVVTGLIKANFPSRVSFAVASQVDSRTILDSVGAERLLGKGDMLFLSSEAPKPKRVQGVFISEEETEALADHWRRQPVRGLPEIDLEGLAYEAERADAVQQKAEVEFNESDSLYDKAVQLAVSGGQMSISLLQRRLRIGYPRAARLMDQLVDDGIVAGAGEPGKPRDVIYRPE
jgi:S-DNA-T family DNA segregation ATPase FtsK/SpoIIIE